MNYYAISINYNTKITGKYPSQIGIESDKNVWCEESIDNFHLKKINIIPHISIPVYHSRVKLTDILPTNGVALPQLGIINTKLKSIIEQFNTADIQFFEAPFIQSNKKIHGYWAMHPIKERMDQIDWATTKVGIYKNQVLTKEVYVKSNDEMLALEKEMKSKGNYTVGFKSFLIKEDCPFDLLYLRVNHVSPFFVSENVMKTIEEYNCTGIEFAPSDITKQEWYKPNGYLETEYGYR